MPDLWPDDFGQDNSTPPVTILREQADLLGRKTRGTVEGLVKTSREVDNFVHQFFAVAPALDNYTYLLFVVVHPIQFYPLEIRAAVMGRGFRSASEEQFIEHLRTILTSDETKRLITALRVQSEVPTA